MAGEVNWKAKYQELKAKYMDSVDVAFRLGYEQGAKESQLDQANQQLAQQQQQMQSMQGGMGQPEQDPSQGSMDADQGPTQPAGPGQGIQQPPDSENPAGTELDQHIAKLESMIAKSEGAGTLNLTDLKGTINDLKVMQKSYLEQLELKKSAKAIPEIAKALHRPAFKLSQQANHNLNSTAKQAVNMQQKIVNDVMQKWEAEEKASKKDILSQLGIEGLTKKE